MDDDIKFKKYMGRYIGQILNFEIGRTYK